LNGSVVKPLAVAELPEGHAVWQATEHAQTKLRVLRTEPPAGV
jgi:hypothetical protein